MTQVHSIYITTKKLTSQTETEKGFGTGRKKSCDETKEKSEGEDGGGGNFGTIGFGWLSCLAFVYLVLSWMVLPCLPTCSAALVSSCASCSFVTASCNARLLSLALRPLPLCRMLFTVSLFQIVFLWLW